MYPVGAREGGAVAVFDEVLVSILPVRLEINLYNLDSIVDKPVLPRL